MKITNQIIENHGLKPNEFENKSREKPKTKAIIMNVILLIFCGNVNMKTKLI